MSVDFQAWADEVKRLYRALGALTPAAAAVGVAPPAGEEWFALLEHKLVAQLDEPFLVVAVVGGTNIGKSVVFNHLAGETASAVSPLAAGTKHPVCLAPPGFADQAPLDKLFEGFSVRPWHSPDDALGESDEHRLFWRVGANVPPSLLLLDTPDIDSDAQVNWQRADQIRQSSDVLIAILTSCAWAAAKAALARGVGAACATSAAGSAISGRGRGRGASTTRKAGGADRAAFGVAEATIGGTVAAATIGGTAGIGLSGAGWVGGLGKAGGTG